MEVMNQVKEGEKRAYHLCPVCSKQKGEEDDDEEDVSS